MENIDVMSLMKQMNMASEELKDNPAAQSQMKDFWNMLNEMSENNPEVTSK